MPLSDAPLEPRPVKRCALELGVVQRRALELGVVKRCALECDVHVQYRLLEAGALMAACARGTPFNDAPWSWALSSDAPWR